MNASCDVSKFLWLSLLQQVVWWDVWAEAKEARTGTACTKPFTDGQTYQAVERYCRLLSSLRCVQQRLRQTYSRAFRRPFTGGVPIHIGSQQNYLPVTSGQNFPKRIFALLLRWVHQLTVCLVKMAPATSHVVYLFDCPCCRLPASAAGGCGFNFYRRTAPTDSNGHKRTPAWRSAFFRERSLCSKYQSKPLWAQKEVGLGHSHSGNFPCGAPNSLSKRWGPIMAKHQV